MVSVTSKVEGFADTGDAHDKVITDTLIDVSKTTLGDVSVDINYLGDFGEVYGLWPDEWFSLDIDGYAIGGEFKGIQSQLTSTNLSIAKGEWAKIIADGSFTVTYTMGHGVDNLDHNPNEFIELTFTWDPRNPPTKLDPIRLSGTGGDDFLLGTNTSDLINGDEGGDSIFAGNSDDIVNGGDGNDIIGGGTGADNLRGDAGNDAIFGGNGNDLIYGGEGNDIAWGGKGADMIRGDAGNDLLGGGLGRDALYGGDGEDVLFGGSDNDRLYGEAGKDTLYGGAGDDYLNGGLGNDILSGGAGADTFVFSGNEGDDVIREFNVKDGDHIDLGGQTYTISENTEGFAVLELSGGGSITLNGVDISDVSDGWFLAA